MNKHFLLVPEAIFSSQFLAYMTHLVSPMAYQSITSPQSHFDLSPSITYPAQAPGFWARACNDILVLGRSFQYTYNESLGG